jgi:hypothetical protein
VGPLGAFQPRPHLRRRLRILVGSADRAFARSSFSRLRLVVETIADFRSSLAGTPLVLVER